MRRPAKPKNEREEEMRELLDVIEEAWRKKPNMRLLEFITTQLRHNSPGSDDLPVIYTPDWTLQAALRGD